MRSYKQYCSVARALDVVGDRWNLLIVRELLLREPLRYTDLQFGLPGIATNLLADRLRELEAAGVVEREAAPPPVATTVFRLTDWGKALRPVVTELGAWGAMLMAGSAEGCEFRSHWLTFPLGNFFRDKEPGSPPVTIELRTGDEPMLMEVTEGAVEAHAGRAEHADLVLAGPPRTVLGVLVGAIPIEEAGAEGLTYEGDPEVLGRLEHLPVSPS
jgi:DNA-binding HxlR family transcriptional regulator